MALSLGSSLFEGTHLIGQVRVPGIHFDRDVVLWIQFWTMRSGFFWWKTNVLTLNEFKCGH